ncbi:hypothetical protein CPS_0102 [Colwellia psychrerythraea 34H]|uniref:Uncharacterized protein n=1 Tax=Colwellia psychrerythraea (strain 34H / ATCC BAA-681) TaxID=167879 RepID=Q48AP3_COLP3|nr:hypothetical protein CPS_0102 [Colwellia psychrerythraea 34H]
MTTCSSLALTLPTNIPALINAIAVTVAFLKSLIIYPFVASQIN